MAFSASAPALGQGQAARRVAPAPQPVLQHAGQQVVALRSDGHDAAARGAAVCHSLATRQLCAPSTSGLHPSLGATPVQMRHAMRNPLTHPRQRGGLGEIGQPSWPRPVQVQVASLPISQIADIEDSGPSTSRPLSVQEKASRLFGQLRDGHVPPSAQCNKLLRSK